MKQFFTLFFLVIRLNCFCQKTENIGIQYYSWSSRNFLEFTYHRANSTRKGLEIGVGVGQYGKRIFDNKTKDIFGLTYDNWGHGVNYYKQSNLGCHLRLEGSFTFVLSRKIENVSGFFIQSAFYNQQVEQDAYRNYYQDTTDLIIQKYSNLRINFALGLASKFQFKISKKLFVSAGLQLPFYILNADKLEISKFFDPPMLGTEPNLSIGLTYRINP